MAEDIGFEEQLEQEKQALAEEEEKYSGPGDRSYTDSDGTIMEWDSVKRAYFPKIDSDFIAQYQMNYGIENGQTSSKETSTNNRTSEQREPTDNSIQAWYDYYYPQQDSANNTSSVTNNESQGSEVASGNATQSSYTSADYQAYYSYYYGEDYMKYFQNQEVQGSADKPLEGSVAEEDKSMGKTTGKNKKKSKEKDNLKRKPEEEAGWFDVDTDKSSHVYISGLPSDITEDEFKDLVTKCGLIMIDPITHKWKLKLYYNKDGTPKGDGLCCYIKSESVDLALKILDGSDVRGNTITVERAKFEMKGDYDPTKKKKKLSNKLKRKLKEKQEKLFDWRPDKPLETTRLRFERIVILKNMFDPKEFTDDPTLINELREDVRSECSKFGDVRKVQVYDHHIDGVVSVTFRTPEEADLCIMALKGRWFAKRRIMAEAYDGKTQYTVNETDAEREERLKGWEKFLVEDRGKENDGAKSDTSTLNNKRDSNLASAENGDAAENDTVQGSIAMPTSSIVSNPVSKSSVESSTSAAESASEDSVGFDVSAARTEM